MNILRVTMCQNHMQLNFAILVTILRTAHPAPWCCIHHPYHHPQDCLSCSVVLYSPSVSPSSGLPSLFVRKTIRREYKHEINERILLLFRIVIKRLFEELLKLIYKRLDKKCRRKNTDCTIHFCSLSTYIIEVGSIKNC